MAIPESLLQFIWQFQYYNKSELSTSTGEALHIISPGRLNHNQGPDFTDAKIIIGTTTWAGTIELHIRASDWQRHKHDGDSNYYNVILHVVWDDDLTSKAGKDVPAVPVLELKSRIPKMLISRYDELMRSLCFIPCEHSIVSVEEIIWQSWKDRLAAGRLMRKSEQIKTFLTSNHMHWEETFWWMLARNFGMKVNADAFEAIARSVPLTILSKHKNQIHQMEALLLGQGGLLEGRFEDEYSKLLQREYHFLQKKYKLKPIWIPLHSLRMRPASFPAVRLAELAMLIKESTHLFSSIRETCSTEEIRNLFKVTANDYWHYHYRLDAEPGKFHKKITGDSFIDNIMINTVAPALFTYGNYLGDQQFHNRALRCLEETAAEINKVTTRFKSLGIEVKNARDSQALIELRNQYCEQKRCLECAIGNAILRKTGNTIP